MIVTFFTLSILIIDHLRDYGFKRDAVMDPASGQAVEFPRRVNFVLFPQNCNNICINIISLQY